MKQQSCPISIIVADDHPAVLYGVADLLRSTADMNVLAACPDGGAAMQAIRTLKPDIAVLDMSMPGFSGLDVLKSIATEGCPTKVVFLTATASDAQLVDAAAGGAMGIVSKEQALDELLQCIRLVAAGRQWLPSHLIDAPRERESRRSSMRVRLAQSLTTREREVFLGVAQGFSNKEVARQLSLCEATVKIHLHNIYKKLGVAKRTILASLAITYRDELSGIMLAENSPQYQAVASIDQAVAV
jgi:DNA-binding NarL/FixJ family response regulator